MESRSKAEGRRGVLFTRGKWEEETGRENIKHRIVGRKSERQEGGRKNG